MEHEGNEKADQLAEKGRKTSPLYLAIRCMVLGCTIRKVAGSSPQNAGAVNLKKTYENASTSFKHGGLQQIPLFGKTYGAGAVKKCTAKETFPKVCHNATENTYVKRG